MEEQSHSPLAVTAGVLILVFALITILLVTVIVALVLPVVSPAPLDSAAVAPVAPVLAHDGPPDPAAYTWELVTDGFDNPVFVTHAGDGSGRLFGLEQGGFIWVIDAEGQQSREPFLDIALLTSPDVMRGTYSERGLLSMAFDPDYAANGTFYIAYTDRDGNSVVSRMQVSPYNPNRADHDSEQIILRQHQPYYDHNGGQLAFGPDGYLYVGFGDGGSIDDPEINAQNPSSWLGKLLRIDVRGGADTFTVPTDNPFLNDPAYLPEIFATGFRNPWRFSFDRATGDLYIADVGQWQWEEIDFLAADSPGGENYGWNLFEANLQRAAEIPVGFSWVPPIVAYDHTQGCSVTGGYVYRGSALPALNGYYLYGDYCNGNVWAAWRDAAGTWANTLLYETGRNISSFGEDEAGELYLVDYKGEILRLTAAEG